MCVVLVCNIGLLILSSPWFLSEYANAPSAVQDTQSLVTQQAINTSYLTPMANASESTVSGGIVWRALDLSTIPLTGFSILAMMCVFGATFICWDVLAVLLGVCFFIANFWEPSHENDCRGDECGSRFCRILGFVTLGIFFQAVVTVLVCDVLQPLWRKVRAKAKADTEENRPENK